MKLGEGPSIDRQGEASTRRAERRMLDLVEDKAGEEVYREMLRKSANGEPFTEEEKELMAEFREEGGSTH